MTNSEKGLLGEKYVKNYLKSKGFLVLDVDENGCDIIARKGHKTTRIEVKTTSNLTGIPDMHITEFKNKKGRWYFVADFLYILRLNNRGVPIQLDILTRREVDLYSGSHKTITRIRTTKLDRDLKNNIVGKIINFSKFNN